MKLDANDHFRNLTILNLEPETVTPANVNLVLYASMCDAGNREKYVKMQLYSQQSSNPHNRLQKHHRYILHIQ